MISFVKLCGLEGGIITACQLTAAFKMPLDFLTFFIMSSDSFYIQISYAFSFFISCSTY